MDTQPRAGSWMQTATGRQFWPMDPYIADIAIEDIAHALSNACRYAGHCLTFYSVAQHSVLVSRALPEEFKLWGLLHDASEAYLVDVPRPVKPYLVGYQEAEDRLMAVIAQAFGLIPATMPDEVKRVDNAILADEAAQLMVKAPAAWHLPEPALNIKITPWSPEIAHGTFLSEYTRLRNDI